MPNPKMSRYPVASHDNGCYIEWSDGDITCNHEFFTKLTRQDKEAMIDILRYYHEGRYKDTMEDNNDT